VELQGLSGVPEAGDVFNAVKEEKLAKVIGEQRQADYIKSGMMPTRKVSLEEFFEQAMAEETKELNIIVKADVQGSVEAVTNALEKLSTKMINANVLHGGVGGISESDVMLASASGAIIIGFNIRPEPSAKALSEKEQIDINLYTVIYDVISDVKKAMEGRLDPTLKEKSLGRAEVRDLFSVSKIGTIAGTSVVEGKIIRGANVRLIRDSQVVFEGKMGSLRRFKDDVKEVNSGYECGISLENFHDIKLGDVIEAYIFEEIAPTLDAP